MLSPQNKITNATLSRLEFILQTYQKIAESDPLKLRSLIPSKEIWRFFISKHHQLQGRKLRDAFVNFETEQQINSNNKQRKNMTPSILALHGNKKIFDYIRDVEGIDPNNPDALPDSDIYAILEDNLWTLTLDQLKALTIQNIFDLDQGWLPYEINEPRYLENLYRAFNTNFQNHPLSLQRLQSLHLLTTGSVKIALFEEHPEEKQGEFRKEPYMHSSIRGDTSSREGIKYILAKQFDHHAAYLDFEVTFNDCSITINPDTLDFIKNDQQGALDIDKLASLFNTSINTFSHVALANKIKALYYDLKSTDNLEELATSITLLSKSQQYSLWLTSNINNIPLDSLEETIQALIHQYQSNIVTAKTPYEKLIAIVTFILDCAHASPFCAANGRTICMNLLNQLLIQNGFPLTILDNQNHFIGYSPEELACDVMDGMENVFQLVEHQNLYGISTQAISEYLEKNQLSDFLDYFNKITAYEEQNRVKPLEAIKSRAFNTPQTFFGSIAHSISLIAQQANKQLESIIPKKSY